MKKIFNYIGVTLISALALTSCSPEDYEGLNEAGLPLAGDAKVTVAVDQTTNQVTLNMDCDKTYPLWILPEDGSVVKTAVDSTLNGMQKIYAKAGDYKWSSHNCYLFEDNFCSKMLDIDPILSLFSEDRQVAVKKYIEYMNEECNEKFIDLEDDVELIDEEQARELYKRMLVARQIGDKDKGKIQIPDSLIKEFKERTNLSLRKIAAITGLNKDKVNKILKT